MLKYDITFDAQRVFQVFDFSREESTLGHSPFQLLGALGALAEKASYKKKTSFLDFITMSSSDKLIL